MFSSISVITLALICLVPLTPLDATTEVILRSRYRIVLASDSRALYRDNGPATECKLFEVSDVYATVSGYAHYGGNYHVTDAIREAFASEGTFERHVSNTALILKRKVEKQLTNLQASDPGEYRYLMQPTRDTSDFIQLALAQAVRGQPMLGIVELRRNGAGNRFTARTTICPSSCSQNTEIFYFGYWERIKPYVANSGRPRSVGSAASIDRLIRLEIAAHPNEVSTPVDILELTGSGARWLQNGGNCSLQGVGW